MMKISLLQSISAQDELGIHLLFEAVKVRLKNKILSLSLILQPLEGKLRHAFYQLDCVRHEQISEQGEFLLDIQIDKIMWLKLCKQFSRLADVKIQSDNG